jgi:DNA-binding LacI/PurR family transcriptional regulator
MLLGDAGDDRKRELELIQGLLNRQVDGLFYNHRGDKRIADIRHHQAKGFGIAGGQGARRSVWPVTVRSRKRQAPRWRWSVM